MNVLVVHGPNLNLLGERQPDIYGDLTLAQINRLIQGHARKKRLEVRIFQSNSEGEILDWLHRQRRWADGIVINPAAYTHYSYAIRDAISAIDRPTVEVHLSNIKKRESFRQHSVIAEVCVAQISGWGWQSYIKGIEFLLANHLR